jgi:hypothetical protein
LGRCVSISANGKRIAASSYFANSFQGVVRIFDFDGAKWNNVGEIDGAQSNERLGYGLLSISLTSDGHRVGAGAAWANNTSNDLPTGQAHVWDDITSPSAAPSQSPSRLPSKSPVTSVLTALGTVVPTVVLSKFDWDLERIGDIAVSFSDATKNEITLNYNISNRPFVITILDKTCNVPVPASIVGFSTTTTIKSSTHSNLDVALEVKKDSVVGSNIWSNGNSGVGYIDLCIRVDLVLDDGTKKTSINFQEQKIYITIDLQEGFSLVNIDLNRNSAAQTNSAASANYTILACQCNQDFVCVNTILAQGSDVFVCIYSNSSGVQVAGISDLTFLQDGFSIAPIVNSTEDAITSVSVSHKGALIHSKMRSEFFAKTDPANVLVEGVAVLAFAANGVRHLRVLSLPRMLQQVKSGDFSVSMGLTKQEKSSGAAKTAITVVLLAMTMGSSLLPYLN